jgi:beta-N-acetylhexosaminidase
MILGPLMVDLSGQTLTQEELELLQHPFIGGVILFSRNYSNITNIIELIKQIQALRNPPLLLAVDHEGGRVQRFKTEFTQLPAMASLGKYYVHDPRQAIYFAEQIAWLLATELRAVGVDFSFTPVLDLDMGISQVIGDRALHSDPEIVTILAKALIRGLKKAGMAAVGKHFPGHGAVAADSHHAIPIDERGNIQADILPFKRLINLGLTAIMPAHVIYSHFDQQPAGFSRYWLQEVLRRQLHFSGAIISDDLSMQGASAVGDMSARVQLALNVGCDLLLLCNDRAAVIKVLDSYKQPLLNPVSQARLIRLRGKRTHLAWTQLSGNYRWRQAHKICHILNSS